MKKAGDKIVVVLPSSMHYEIIRKAHENGHFGAKKIMEALQEEYYIPKLKEKAENFIECYIPWVLSNKRSLVLHSVTQRDTVKHSYVA